MYEYCRDTHEQALTPPILKWKKDIAYVINHWKIRCEQITIFLSPLNPKGIPVCIKVIQCSLYNCFQTWSSKSHKHLISMPVILQYWLSDNVKKILSWNRKSCQRMPISLNSNTVWNVIKWLSNAKCLNDASFLSMLFTPYLPWLYIDRHY